MKIYISGPISIDPNYMEHFTDAEQALAAKYPDAVILNPTILPAGLSYKEYIQIDMAMLECSDTIAMINGWEFSPGACAELEYARALKIKQIFLGG